jgi:dolichyl-phosphate-mannose-protein mannosyltransferase
MGTAGGLSGPGNRWQVPLRGLLLGAAFLIPLLLMGGKSATFDEVVHLPAGYSYLATRAIQINPQHPPLIKEICALPLLFMDVRMPVDPETLRKTSVSLTYQWKFGRQFLYSQNADRLLFWGRVPAVLLSLGLAALVMIWAGKLWGGGAALAALFLYVFDPTITAHAQLVTTDVGLAFFSTLFLFLYRRYLEKPGRRRLVLAGVALGLALGAKFSAVILLPVAFLLALVAGRQGSAASALPAAAPGKERKGGGARKGGAKGKPARKEAPHGAGILISLGALGWMAVIAAGVVWVLYFFPTDPFFYLKGMEAVNRDHDPNYFPYLMGEMKRGGWIYYLLIAYLVKTPLPTLILLAASVVLYVRGRRAAPLDEAFLAIPSLAFFAGYSLTADNLGVRYLIPCFPLLFIFASRVAPAAASAGRLARVALAAALIWIFVEFAAIWPDHLSYFNEITGVPPRGVEWLDDSNLDWGQGLIQLRDYLKQNPGGDDFGLCYFGSGEPTYYGIRGRKVGVDTLMNPPPAGRYILSAHCVARARAELSRIHGEGAGNWLAHRAPDAVVGHAFFVYYIR